jgi:branched-chain amino acid transport system ATP-binding protein
MTAGLLQLEGLRAGYGHVEVLHGVNLSVPEGRMVAIVGPNGAGKTTLMGAVMGLLPRRGGTVRYRGALAGATEALVASGALLVPEQRALFTDMSVEDNLLLGFYPRRRAGERDALLRCARCSRSSRIWRNGGASLLRRSRVESGRCSHSDVR